MLPQQSDQKIRNPAAIQTQGFSECQSKALITKTSENGVEEKLADESPYAAFSKTNVSPVCECSILQW